MKLITKLENEVKRCRAKLFDSDYYGHYDYVYWERKLLENKRLLEEAYEELNRIEDGIMRSGIVEFDIYTLEDDNLGDMIDRLYRAIAEG